MIQCFVFLKFILFIFCLYKLILKWVNSPTEKLLEGMNMQFTEKRKYTWLLSTIYDSQFHSILKQNMEPLFIYQIRKQNNSFIKDSGKWAFSYTFWKPHLQFLSKYQMRLPFHLSIYPAKLCTYQRE